MTYLKKEEIFFERDDEGNVLAIDVILETLPDKPTIKATPLTKGELAKIVNSAKGQETDIDADIDIVIKHCKEPAFIEADRESLKTAGKSTVTSSISLAILSISTGIEQSKIMDEGKKNLVEKELQAFPTQ